MIDHWTPGRLFNEVVMPAQIELIRMEYRGMRVDEKLRKQRRRELRAKIKKMVADPVLDGCNPWSWQQVRNKLHGWKVTKAKSTNERTLKKIRARRMDVSPFITHILKCRKARKLLTQIGAPIHPDGRMRTAYKLHVAETGRGRSGPDVFGLGMNLQNVPIDQRDWIVPDDSLVFWSAGASQIEAMIMAWMSEDKDYIKAFLEGRDLHTEHAVKLFTVKKEDVDNPISKDSDWTYRDASKKISRAWGYWISPSGLVDRINEEIPNLLFTTNSAQRHLDALGYMHSGVNRWRLRIVEQLKRSRTLTTPYGRSRAFLGPWRAGDPTPNSLHREAIVHLLQSTAGDHFHQALVQTASRLRSIPEAECLLYTHSEIAGQCRRQDLGEVAQIVREEISRPLPLEWQGKPLVCPTEFGSGASWRESRKEHWEKISHRKILPIPGEKISCE